MLGLSLGSTIASVLLGVSLCTGLPSSAAAQATPARTQSDAPGAFPDADFDVMFRKLGPPPNPFAPFYSWDAHMAFDVTVFRGERNAVEFATVFQTVGTENVGAKVSVGGTGYVIRAAYAYRVSNAFSLSAGVSHLSSHLTRDLDEKTLEQRRRGIPIPDVLDSDEYNIVFLKGTRRFDSTPLRPQIAVSLEPFEFRFDGHRSMHARPLYVTTRWTPWHGQGRRLTAETQHEIGRRSWNDLALFLSLFGRGDQDGGFQLFASVSPGRGMHVSPNVGGLRDGVAFGVRMRFRSTP
jgi:hypothetical protein